ncbi:MAG: hypothetical protein HOM68_06575 [Gemmatimonadetes bacterium]|jgi:hypothetical protein|nr:hypothetical protein [Gemmatimonadota bacterium]MBT4612662.1 hypothetical protein [Gemmatimonadota bacterium]MBT5056185.1 hypothetical protein [Gemmatimonadota bacterium]MBT5141426.1 hypothetical protein [Gemmatimonadota bacterium]MBT5590659.1 hypothetical protein [Gemmatimonadota bacterium]
MGLLLIGLVVVGLATGFIMSDMERKRRALSELVERLEPLVPRNRRLALHNLRRLSQSLFYAQNLMSQIERELLLLEKEKEIEVPVVDASRFAFRTSVQLAGMFQRLVTIEESVGIAEKAAAEEKAAAAEASALIAEAPPEDPGLASGAAAG